MMHTFVRAIVLPACGALLLASACQAGDVSVSSRGPHHRTWQRVTEMTRADRTKYSKTNSYVELEIGAHYKGANGEWLESQEIIEIANGMGIAERGAHKARFAANIRTTGGIQLSTPEGHQMRSHIYCIAYTDSRTGQSVLIAEPKDSIGEVAGNQLIYPDAFTDIIADVRYTYTKAGLEQDIIFLENPPPPEDYGIPSEFARLEVFTEFVEAPAPQKHQTVLTTKDEQAQRGGMFEPDLTDEYLDFGAMAMGAGKAFPADTPLDFDNSAPVGKAWLTIDQRMFLVEKVDYSAVRAELQKLPQAAAVRRGKAASRQTMLAQLGNRAGGTQGGSLQLARVDRRNKGYVIDYQIVSSASNVTFQADNTYFVPATATLTGTTRIEGGTIIKTTNGTTFRLIINGPLDCATSSYRPAIFTGKDDDTVGSIVAGSTGNPTTNYYGIFLNFASNTNAIEVHNVQMRHGYYAFYVNATPKATISHAQLTRNYAGFVNAGVRMRNVLVHDGTYVIGGAAAGTEVEHLTVHRVPNFRSGVYYASLTNCLLISTTNYVYYNGVNVVTNRDDTGFFQALGAATHYLASGSTNRNAGTTNINPSLLADLKLRTTYPPVLLTNNITTATTLTQQAPRDTGLPDLGYSYAPLDYAVKDITVSAAVTVPAGTAVGVYGASGSRGFLLMDGGSIVAEGTPVSPCRFVRYNLVQEEAANTWAASSCGVFLETPSQSTNPKPTGQFRFTHFSMPAGGSEHLYVGFEDHPAIMFTDCELGSGRFWVDYAGVTFTNCLLDRVESTFLGIVGKFQNVLFHGGSAVFGPLLDPYVVSDCVFDKTTIDWLYGDITHDYNGYITNAVNQFLSPSGSNDVFTNSFTFLSGLLGRFYQPTNTIFVNAGSRSGADAGLSWYTCFTNNVPDTNTVDFGYHLIALDGSGQPLDGDGDGLPDYFEDSDGDGSWDSGTEINFADADTDDDGVSDYTEWIQGRNPLVNGSASDSGSLIKLQVYTPLK